MDVVGGHQNVGPHGTGGYASINGPGGLDRGDLVAHDRNILGGVTRVVAPREDAHRPCARITMADVVDDVVVDQQTINRAAVDPEGPEAYRRTGGGSEIVNDAIADLDVRDPTVGADDDAGSISAAVVDGVGDAEAVHGYVIREDVHHVVVFGSVVAIDDRGHRAGSALQRQALVDRD